MSLRQFMLKSKCQGMSEFEEEFFVPDIMQLKCLALVRHAD